MTYSVKDKGKHISRMRRHQQVRRHVFGSTKEPRLVVTRSNRHMVAQLIDDYIGKILVSASTVEDTLQTSSDKKIDKAREASKLIAQRTRAAGITTIVFDHGGSKYHGRVVTIAEDARGGELNLWRK